MAFSPTAEALLHEAKRISLTLDTSLTLIHAGAKNASSEKKVADLLLKVDLKSSNVKVIWKEGKPVEVLTEVCLSENVDLLILGALKHETILKHYIGSIARKISRNPPCSILLITDPKNNASGLRKVVINGIDNNKTQGTIEKACDFATSFKAKKITIVEEVTPQKVTTKIEDNLSLEKAYHEKEEIKKLEDQRILKILEPIRFNNNTVVSIRCVFGKIGYSISHYAEVKKASLLVMNSPDNKLGVLDRFFPHDLEYVLSDMPCDLMIVHNN